MAAVKDGNALQSTRRSSRPASRRVVWYVANSGAVSGSNFSARHFEHLADVGVHLVGILECAQPSAPSREPGRALPEDSDPEADGLGLGNRAAAKRMSVIAKPMLSRVHKYTARRLACEAWIAM